MTKRNKAKKGFTLIELIITIAVLAILVLIGAPRLLGYTQRAELTRIQHDTRVMENKMKNVLLEAEINDWQQNEKVFGPLIMEEKLYEKEGVAQNVDATHLSRDGLFSLSRYFRNIMNETEDSEIGVGGDFHVIDELPEDFLVEKTYKIIPEEFKDEINTNLDGTFYVNTQGKVYYEHDKPLSGESSENQVSCPTAAPDYEFEHETGTITKWHGTETHLTIPEEFLVDGKCYPVRIIGTGAFMNGNFRRVTIPHSVVRIEERAFQDGELTELTIPHSVNHIGNGAFSGNNFSSSAQSVTILNSVGGIFIGTNAFGSADVHFRAPTPSEAGFIFHYNSRTIISRTSSSGAGLLTIPERVTVNDEEYEVNVIKAGAFQGAGLIDVVLPSGLERIEDYAFAGNRLKRVEIPEKVYYIGNYAFAFNQEEHSISGAIRPTIKSIIIKDSERISNVEQGNINIDIPGVELKDFVWVTEADNFDFEEFDYYNEVDTNNNNEENEDIDEENEEIVEDEEPNGLRKPTDNEIVITDAQSLHDIRNNLDGKYILMNDIDLGEYNWIPIGNSSLNEFTGEFDGNGFVISNLTINKSQFSFDTGLFGRTNGAIISNVSIVDANVVAGSQTGTLAGYVSDNSIIKNSYATGIVGGNRHAAGLVGNLIGGSEIINSYSTVEVYHGHDTWYGGLSSATQANRIHNSFWDINTSGISSHSSYTENSGAVGLTTEEMKQADTYSEWDTNIWNIVDGEYPTLRNSH